MVKKLDLGEKTQSNAYGRRRGAPALAALAAVSPGRKPVLVRSSPAHSLCLPRSPCSSPPRHQAKTHHGRARFELAPQPPQAVSRPPVARTTTTSPPYTVPPHPRPPPVPPVSSPRSAAMNATMVDSTPPWRTPFGPSPRLHSASAGIPLYSRSSWSLPRPPPSQELRDRAAANEPRAPSPRRFTGPASPPRCTTRDQILGKSNPAAGNAFPDPVGFKYGLTSAGAAPFPLPHAQPGGEEEERKKKVVSQESPCTFPLFSPCLSHCVLSLGLLACRPLKTKVIPDLVPVCIGL